MNGRDTKDLPLMQPLTPREEEVLTLIGEGRTNRQIAEELTVAMSTVKWYVRQIYNKLSVDSREEAIARARGLGLLAAEEQEGAIRHNLPVAATPFVGRSDELAALAALIADPHARIITITGPGGIGKTCLALEAAGRELHPQSHFPDGVFFVSLAPLESAAEIAATLATTLDFQFPGSGNETEQLLDYLRQKQMLLVMDNFEHILEGRTLLAEINEQAAGVTLLVTSRERLQLRGEQLFPLHGLEMAYTADSAEEAPAAQLFLNIARRTAHDFQLLEGDAELLLHICRLVEGMPLGLELAASWAGLLPLSEIAAEIEQSLDLLSAEHHDVPQRHQSMEATLDVSWRRQTTEQQRGFQTLTVFRGGFTRTGAIEVAGASLPLLVTLANKSWLSYDRQKDRYHIHELLRQYGAEKLSADSSREQEARELHSAYFCGYLQDREEDWYGPRQQQATAEVAADIDNIQRAWRWAANRGDGILLAMGLKSLCIFYLREGRLKNGEIVCRLAREGLSRSLAESKDDWQRSALWSKILVWESSFVRELAQKKALLAQSQQLLDRARQTGRDTRTEQAHIFLEKAYAAEYTDIEKTIRLASLGLELFRELGDRASEAEALTVVGKHYLSLGEHDRANDLVHESLQLRRQMSDTQGVAASTNFLGSIARYQGRFEDSEKFHRKGLELYRLLGNRLREARWLMDLSYTLSWAGNFLVAEEVARQAIKIDQELGLHPNPRRLNPLTMAIFHRGHYDKVRIAAPKSLDLARQRGISAIEFWAMIYLGNIAFIDGNLAEAKRYLQESETILTELKHVQLATSQAILGYVVRAEGDSQLAHEKLVIALRAGIGSRFIFPIFYCLPLAALLVADEGHTKRAIELYGLAQQFGHITNSRWFADVACNELDEVRASLPEDVAAAAEARGREMDVWETAEALLRELDGSQP